MQVVILCNNRSKEELLDQIIDPANLVWISNREDFLRYPGAAACMDLQFENKKEQLHLLQQLLPRTIIINSVLHTLEQTHRAFIRINAWPGFLKGSVVEGACSEEATRERALDIFSGLGKSLEWLPDEPGFITPRVVSMIINEAYFALDDGVSTKEEIDTAMKLGTNYPYGPFEWAQMIGLHQVADLLQTLSRKQTRYTPCPLLLKEASLPGTAPPTG